MNLKKRGPSPINSPADSRAAVSDRRPADAAEVGIGSRWRRTGETSTLRLFCRLYHVDSKAIRNVKVWHLKCLTFTPGYDRLYLMREDGLEAYSPWQHGFPAIIA